MKQLCPPLSPLIGQQYVLFQGMNDEGFNQASAVTFPSVSVGLGVRHVLLFFFFLTNKAKRSDSSWISAKVFFLSL